MKNSDTYGVQTENAGGPTRTMERRVSNYGGLKLKLSDTLCGIGGFKPRWLQVFAKIGVFTGFNSVAYCMMSSLLSYVNSQVTTLERQFGLPSKQTAVILISNDISYIFTVLLASYVGQRVHVPRIIGLGVFIMGVSGIICTLPHFIYGASNLDVSAAGNSTAEIEAETSLLYGDMCRSDGNRTVASCSVNSTGPSSEKVTSVERSQMVSTSLTILVIGMLLQGIGKGPRFSYAVTYVDNNTRKVNTGFHIGITIAMSLSAPVVTFLLGGVFTNIYVTLQDTHLTPDHPKWIGAWWLGYLIYGIIAIFVSGPLFLFPRGIAKKPVKDCRSVLELDEKKLVEDRQIEAHESNGIVRESSKAPPHHSHKSFIMSKLKWIFNIVKDFVVTLIRLNRNPVYFLTNLCGILIIFSVSGLAFRAKFLEDIFDMPAHEANYLMAIVMLCSKCLGTFLGGVVSKRMKMTAYKALWFTILALIVSLIGSFGGFVFYCEQPEVINRPGSLENCSAACQCEDNSFFPVCGDDGRTYYSPCHAGCLEVESGVYSNCSCIAGGTATRGVCDFSCNAIYPYVVSAIVCALFQTLTIIPKLIIYVRSVEPRDKTVAIGFHSFTTTLLGWLLGELVLGVAIDGVCDIWDVNCGVSGRCLLYDNDRFRTRIHAYASVALSGAIVSVFLAWLYAWRKGILRDHEDARSDVLEVNEEKPERAKMLDRDVNS